MRKVIVSEFVTLDSGIEDPGGAEKSKYGGWTLPYWNEDIAKFKFDELFSCEALLLGWVTYQGFAVAWPSRKDEEGSLIYKRSLLLPPMSISESICRSNISPGFY